VAQGYDADPAALRRAATELTAVTDDLQEAVNAFFGGMSGDPWGSDMLGMLIGGGYVAVEKLATRTVQSVLEAFDGIAENLEQMADTYEAADTGSADTFAAIAGEL
jgi:Excreted virulence factor EspC, type VII ESX diderm